jgi:hypothetical protein
MSRLALWAALLLCAGSAGRDQPLEAVVLQVHHRVYAGFQEEHRVAPGESFVIGDTDYSARIVDFLPDFVYDDQAKKATTRSNELRNPAVRVEVLQNGRKVEDVWAFRGEGPPHYGRNSMLAFRIKELVWRPGQEPPIPPPAADSTKATADSTSTGRADPAEPSGKQ